MAFCTRCGNKLVEEAAFCAICGAQVKAEYKDRQPSIVPEEKAGKFIKPLEATTKKKGFKAVAAALFLIAAGAGALCFFIINGKPGFHSTPSTAVTWSKTFGGQGSDFVSFIQPTSDGGYVVAGGTQSSSGKGDTDAWVFKIDDSGNTLWEKTFGGRRDDYAVSVRETHDGGYIIAGVFNRSSMMAFDEEEGEDFELLSEWQSEVDVSGKRVWYKIENGKKITISENELEQAFGEKPGKATFDDLRIYKGDPMKHGELWVMKLDSLGNEQWSKTYEGTGATSILEIPDGEYVVTGIMYSYESLKDGVVLKMDEHGNQKWIRTFGGDHHDNLNSILHTHDGGYVVVGSTYSYGDGSSDSWVVKLDPSGGIIWSKTFGEQGFESAYSAELTTDGRIVVAVNTDSIGGSGNGGFWLLSLDQAGGKILSRTYRGKGETRQIRQTTDGGFIIAGCETQNGAFWVAKTDGAGNQKWVRTFGEKTLNRSCSVHQLSDGGYIVAGITGSGDFNRKTDVLVLKLDSRGKHKGGF
ncbi:MAG: zinc-ribbon domain-containing protein [bacterium]